MLKITKHLDSMMEQKISGAVGALKKKERVTSWNIKLPAAMKKLTLDGQQIPLSNSKTSYTSQIHSIENKKRRKEPHPLEIPECSHTCHLGINKIQNRRQGKELMIFSVCPEYATPHDNIHSLLITSNLSNHESLSFKHCVKVHEKGTMWKILPLMHKTSKNFMSSPDLT